MTRLERLHALAWTLPDTLPAPKALQLGERGEIATEWRRCPNCDGTRNVPDRFRRAITCPTCQGRGGFRVDPYTGARRTSVVAADRLRVRSVLCDRCAGTGAALGRLVAQNGDTRCVKCDGTGRVTVPIHPEDPDADAAVKMSATRDPHELLTAALTVLASEDTNAYRAFSVVRVSCRRPPPAGGPFAQRVERAERRLLELLPDPLRVPRWAVDAWQQRAPRALARERARVGRLGRRNRAELAREMVAAGMSTERVAERLGVSARTIRADVSAGA